MQEVRDPEVLPRMSSAPVDGLLNGDPKSHLRRMSLRRWFPRVSLIVLVLGGVIPAPTLAQLPADTTAVQIIRRVTEERWIHEDAPPEFVPTKERVEAFHAREIGRRGFEIRSGR